MAYPSSTRIPAGTLLPGEAASTPAPPPPPSGPSGSRQPIGLHVAITSADGRITRLHDNSPDPGKRPQGLRFTTARADGFRDCQFRLARRADRDHPDIRLWDEVHVISDTGEVAWEGYVASRPRQVDDAHAINIECVGWMAATKDHHIAFLGVDRDTARWGPMARSVRTNRLTSGIGPHDPTGSPDNAGAPAVVLSINTPPTVRQIAEALYDAGAGRTVASIYYAVTGSGIGNAPWDLRMYSGTNDNEFLDASGSLAVDGLRTGTYRPLTARRFAHLVLDSNGASDSAAHEASWTNMAVYGDHSLPTYGDEPKGLSASDVIGHVIDRYVPQLRRGEIRQTTYPIRHLAPEQPVLPYELMLDVNKYHRFGLEVWENRALHYTSPDLSIHRWEIQTDDPEHPVTVGLQGDTIDGHHNGIAVTYEDFFGGRGRVTPDDDSSLVWSDPGHEATRHGRKVWEEYTAPHRTTRADAIQMARAKLAESNMMLSPGTFTLLSGWVKDRMRIEHPAWKVRAGQTLAYVSHPDDQPRLITETTYDHDSKVLTASVDNALATFEGIVDRWTTELQAAGLT